MMVFGQRVGWRVRRVAAPCASDRASTENSYEPARGASLHTQTQPFTQSGQPLVRAFTSVRFRLLARPLAHIGNWQCRLGTACLFTWFVQLRN